jgi:2-polyprenyl-3-methyl-5-hydroxy-6-metoxy-1,4-benzoquinol methylase
VDDASVSRMLDGLFSDRRGDWWTAFFTDRAEPCPFLVDWPDENLIAWFGEGLLAPGRALELGCGNGRNAVHLASLGCTVDAVDFSAQAIEWAQKRARSAGAAVTLQCCSILTRRSSRAGTTLSTTRAASTICRHTAAGTTSTSWTGR